TSHHLFPSLTTTRPPPLSTPFPYTTLFRSHRRVVAVRRSKSEPRAAIGGSDRRLHRRECERDRADAEHDHRSRAHLSRPAAEGRDRKSTRLNSSHQIISYAVFCLKKKKTER